MWLLKHFGIKSKSIFAPHFRYFSDCVRFIMQIHIYNLSFNPWPSGTKYVDILAMKFYLLQNLSGMKIQRKSELVTRWKVQDLVFILLCIYTSFCFVFLCSIWVFLITLPSCVARTKWLVIGEFWRRCFILNDVFFN